MEQRRTPEYTLEVFADPACVKDVVKGMFASQKKKDTRTAPSTFAKQNPLCVILTDTAAAGLAILHTIFFHRYFTPIRPLTRDLLDTTLPAIDDVDLETLIDQRASALDRQINSASAFAHQSGRGQLVIQFFEKRRRKTYFSFGKADEEVCWEQWLLDVTLATPRTESGQSLPKSEVFQFCSL